MRILYGVQATGQGHISRARAMAEAFSRHSLQVTWLFSGREQEDLFDMEPFGHYKWRRGLTFSSRNGRVNYLKTLRDNDFKQLVSDVRHLDLQPYDLVVTDYEPITAWAAKLRHCPCIGIGHQYAFGPFTPAKGDFVSRLVMRNFAPVNISFGLHWHPYAANVLPPILDLPATQLDDGNFVLVYLPFENQDRVSELLNKVPEASFIQYARDLPPAIHGNVIRRRANTASFKAHLARCSGVICNSGFELISECLQWRKPVLTKPLHRQMEQVSNALALDQLGYARSTTRLGTDEIRTWLQSLDNAPALNFPDVAAELANWLANNCREPANRLSARLWQNTRRLPRPSGPALPNAA